MAELSFDCLDVRPLRHAVAPTLLFRLRIAELTGTPIHTIALRCQMRIEPRRRRYDEHEGELLAYLFGERSRWGETLKPIQFTSVSTLVPAFTGSVEAELAVPCSYDLEVASGKYLHALADGDVPLLLLFSGTVFAKGAQGFQVHQVPWHKEATYRLPVAVWRELMDIYFPGEGWLRLRRDTVDALLRYKSEHAIPTWDAAVDKLLADAGGGRT
ncbi:DUF6084 family protein [Prauserella cavernicola]|uniref:Uncharacterized protein n=1 Tax=Prauserella cavernicola TaxID=2800127 RepID=A0A934QQX0_9PSEU|nr:DUF6084 family protein [Prauserella cavernicola]MBK1784955.1 hypothetical protein [Prauserella cavernicola]